MQRAISLNLWYSNQNFQDIIQPFSCSLKSLFLHETVHVISHAPTLESNPSTKMNFDQESQTLKCYTVTSYIASLG